MQGAETFVLLDAFSDLKEPELGAHLCASVFAWALRNNTTPREVLDTAFKHIVSDETWRSEMEPFLRDHMESE